MDPRVHISKIMMTVVIMAIFDYGPLGSLGKQKIYPTWDHDPCHDLRKTPQLGDTGLGGPADETYTASTRTPTMMKGFG